MKVEKSISGKLDKRRKKPKTYFNIDGIKQTAFCRASKIKTLSFFVKIKTYLARIVFDVHSSVNGKNGVV